MEREHDDIRPFGQLTEVFDRLAADLRASSCARPDPASANAIDSTARASASTVAHPRAIAAAMLPAPANPIRIGRRLWQGRRGARPASSG